MPFMVGGVESIEKVIKPGDAAAVLGWTGELANRRCNCTIGSGMGDALFLFNISRPRRLTERNKVS
jgi:hypothetical protein